MMNVQAPPLHRECRRLDAECRRGLKPTSGYPYPGNAEGRMKNAERMASIHPVSGVNPELGSFLAAPLVIFPVARGLHWRHRQQVNQAMVAPLFRAPLLHFHRYAALPGARAVPRLEPARPMLQACCLGGGPAVVRQGSEVDREMPFVCRGFLLLFASGGLWAVGVE
jgi:hypothetical protein